MSPPVLTPPPAERVVRRRIRRDPQPRFKQDCSAQLDAVARTLSTPIESGRTSLDGTIPANPYADGDVTPTSLPWESLGERLRMK